MAQNELLQQLSTVHRTVKRRFIEWHDSGRHGEHWRMPPTGYDGQQVLRDDCDGFCLACRKLLRDAGIRSRLVYCEVSGGGHLVVEVEGWILDNRQRIVVPNTLLLGYRWLRISGYQPGEPWRAITGLLN